MYLAVHHLMGRGGDAKHLAMITRCCVGGDFECEVQQWSAGSVVRCLIVCTYASNKLLRGLRWMVDALLQVVLRAFPRDFRFIERFWRFSKVLGY